MPRLAQVRNNPLACNRFRGPAPKGHERGQCCRARAWGVSFQQRPRTRRDRQARTKFGFAADAEIFFTSAASFSFTENVFCRFANGTVWSVTDQAAIKAQLWPKVGECRS